MDVLGIIEKQNAQWAKDKLSFVKADFSFIGNKSTRRGRLVGFLTKAYRKRSELIANGEIGLGYVIRFWEKNDVNVGLHPVWILYSPQKKFVENPDVYLKIIDNIEELRAKKKYDKKLRAIKNALFEPYADAEMLELPPELANGGLVYLSIIYRYKETMPDLRLGPNLVIVNPSVSKEILFLPRKYWVAEWEGFYFNGLEGE